MKRFLIVFGAIITLLAALGAAAFFGLGFWLSPQSSLAKSDAIVAISGGETASRAAEAIRLYKEGWAPKIIFSGAAQDRSGPSNARAMENLAVASGVPRSAILLDETSVNTTENAASVAAIVAKNQFHQIILITSPYHQRRASVTFSRALTKQIVILNHSTTDQNWRRSKWWANSYSRVVTLTELQKTLYVIITNRVST